MACVPLLLTRTRLTGVPLELPAYVMPRLLAEASRFWVTPDKAQMLLSEYVCAWTGIEIPARAAAAKGKAARRSKERTRLGGLVGWCFIIRNGAFGFVDKSFF